MKMLTLLTLGLLGRTSKPNTVFFLPITITAAVPVSLVPHDDSKIGDPFNYEFRGQTSLCQNIGFTLVLRAELNYKWKLAAGDWVCFKERCKVRIYKVIHVVHDQTSRQQRIVLDEQQHNAEFQDVNAWIRTTAQEQKVHYPEQVYGQHWKSWKNFEIRKVSDQIQELDGFYS
jgi:hypothetical protein